MKKVLSTIALVVVLASTTACSSMNMGDMGAKTTATGSAGGDASENANAKLEKCSSPLGTVAIADYAASGGGANVYVVTAGPSVQNSPAILKLIAQQSGCFIVVDRGAAMSIASQDRAMRDSGELRTNSKHHKGQVVAADYTLTPSLTSSGNGGGGTGSLGGLMGGVAGWVASSVQSKEASALISMVDNRSSVQVAVAEGSAKNYDIGGFGSLLGSGIGGAVGVYANTPEGKVTVAAYMDAFNSLVKSTRNYKAQTQAGGLGSGGKLKVN